MYKHNSTFWKKVGPKYIPQPFGKRLDQNTSHNLLEKGWTKIHPIERLS